jgi:hypothetical protein
MAKDGKDRMLAAHADCIVAPLTLRNHAAIERKDGAEFASVEHDFDLAGRRVALVIVPWLGAVRATERNYGFIGHLT